MTRKLLMRTVLPLILVTGAVIGAWIFTWQKPVALPTAGVDANGVLRFSHEIPAEVPVPETYTVPDGDPLSIEISNQGIKGYVQKVGIDQHKAIAVPSNVGLVGWFVDSVKPGQKGLSILDGHVSGRSTGGVFKKLPYVKLKDTITITMGGGQKFNYSVFDTKTVPTDQAVGLLFNQDPKVTSQLNLITCTGRYDAGAQTYDKRVIVSASLK